MLGRVWVDLDVVWQVLLVMGLVMIEAVGLGLGVIFLIYFTILSN
jgi:hypothetical protein